MTSYLQLTFLSLAGGVFSLLGAILLLSRKKLAHNLMEYATPFAAGALLSAVFLDLLKDGLHEASSDTVLTAALLGMVLFFFAERFLHWFHHHHQHEGQDVTIPLIILGDTLHNAMDGVAIAAAFLLHPATGLITTLAVAAHEIPQEIGDFGLLLSKGMSRRKVIIANVLSAFATVVAALFTYTLGSADTIPLGFVLGLSGGFLLYIAASDIIPAIHEKTPNHTLFDWRPFLLVLGVVIVGVSIKVAHQYIDVSRDHYQEGTMHQAEHETGANHNHEPE